MPVGGDPRSGQDRGPAAPPQGPPPSRAELLLEEVLKELRVANQQRTQERMQPPKSDFLSKISPNSVIPFYRLLFNNYSNVLGTVIQTGSIKMPQGTALVVTQFVPLFFDYTTQFLRLSNDYAMIAYNKFDVLIDGTTIGDFSIQGGVGSPAGSYPGLAIQQNLTDLLGFTSGFYTAIVRGGRLMTVTSTVTAVIGGGGNIPNVAAMQVGGFKVQETLLNKVLGTE